MIPPPLETLPHELDRSNMTCQAIVEAPAGSRVKVYYDPESHRFRIGKHFDKPLHQRQSLGLVAGVVMHLPAAGLLSRKHDGMAQAFEHAGHRDARLRKQGVVIASDKK